MSLRYFHPAASALRSDSQPDATVMSRPVPRSRTRARQPPPCCSTENGRMDLRAVLRVMYWLLTRVVQVAVSDSGADRRSSSIRLEPAGCPPGASPRPGTTAPGAATAWTARAAGRARRSAADVLGVSAGEGIAGRARSSTMAATCEGVSRYSRPHRLCAYPLRLIIHRSAHADLPGKYRWHASSR